MARPRLKKSIRADKLLSPRGPGDRPTRTHGFPFLDVNSRVTESNPIATTMYRVVESLASVLSEALSEAKSADGLGSGMSKIVALMMTAGAPAGRKMLLERSENKKNR